jgi:hypothetical protein
VLGLPEQISGQEVGIGRLVGMSTGSTSSMPNDTAARACTPPTHSIWSAPQLAIV